MYLIREDYAFWKERATRNSGQLMEHSREYLSNAVVSTSFVGELHSIGTAHFRLWLDVLRS